MIMIILNHKIKIKSEILIRAFDENHIIFITHIIYMISDDSDKTEVDQKIIFSSKNMIIAEKIIFVLDVTTQIIQLKPANIYLT